MLFKIRLAPEKRPQMNTPDSSYYLEHKIRLLKEHHSMMKAGGAVIIDRYGDMFAEQVIRETLLEFELLIPQLPYVGGFENSMTDTITKTATPLALYHVLKRHGKPVQEIGELVYRIGEAWVKSYPELMRTLIGKYYLSGHSRRKREGAAEQSQQREFSEGFVYEVVPGNDGDFDWGINFHECAILKYFTRLGAKEFAPYMCQLDYVLYQALNIGLERTTTIAQDGVACDFRFKRGRKTPDGWPPAFLQPSEET
jgi:hypothetical protein